MTLSTTKNTLSQILMYSCLSLILMSASCKNQKEEQKTENSELYQLSGQFLIHQPHCGGRAAEPQKVKKNPPYKNKKFVVKKGSANKEDTTVVLAFQTDQEGKFNIQLPKGNYCILKAHKNIPFTIFYSLNQKPYDRFFAARDETCFQDWWAKCELSMELTKDTSLAAITLFNRCFVAENPCMDYEGPMPP